MEEKSANTPNAINKLYFISVITTAFVLPILAVLIENLTSATPISFALFGKWFVFSAAGLRLFIAGIKQATNPAFTAKEIFHIQTADSCPVVRELGFANICFGLTGIISLFKPEWRIVSAFASGIYYGFAMLLHIIKKPAGKNEQFALYSDAVIFALLLVYFVMFI